MKMIVRYMYYIFVMLSITSCSIDFGYDYRLSSLKKCELKYQDLPDDVRTILYSSAVGMEERNRLLFVNPADSSRYQFKIVESAFVSSWIAYYKLIDTDKNIVYRIEQGVPEPYIIDSKTNKLYIPSDYILLSRINIAYDSIKKLKGDDSVSVVERVVAAANERIYNSVFTEYELK